MPSISHRPQHYFSAFVWYDWAVTLSREVRLFWGRKARPLPTALYFSNKYSNLFPPIVALLAMTPASDEVRVLSLFFRRVPEHNSRAECHRREIGTWIGRNEPCLYSKTPRSHAPCTVAQLSPLWLA